MLRFRLKSGFHDRRHCPVRAIVPSGLDASKPYVLRLDDGREFPCQLRRLSDGGVELLAIVEGLPKGAEYDCELAESAGVVGSPVWICEGSEEGSYDIGIGDGLFTTLHCGEQWARPFCHPVVDARGAWLTRSYPILTDVFGETNDHPHQKSFWSAWGDLNGEDGWSEDAKRGFSRALVKQSEIVENGPLVGTIRLDIEHLSRGGDRILSESRTMSVMSLGTTRAVDLDVDYHATDCDVRFGDTKEGGICSVRVATSMDGTGAGVITLSDGSTGEGECWGKRSAWCDYSGPVGRGMSGIAILDHPGNFRFPTYWHVRNYGLMTANPFGLSYFYNDKSRDGSYVLPQGKRLLFRYRVLFHLGNHKSSDVSGCFQDFINPAVLKAIES